MQIKEYEAYTLKECLQQVRDDLGPEAVILETRKIRKGGVLGLGARDAVCIVAATGIAVKEDIAQAKRVAGGQSGSGNGRGRDGGGSTPARPNATGERGSQTPVAPPPATSSRNTGSNDRGNARPEVRSGGEDRTEAARPQARVVSGQGAAVAAARNAYARNAASSPSTRAPASASEVSGIATRTKAPAVPQSARDRATERMRNAGFYSNEQYEQYEQYEQFQGESQTEPNDDPAVEPFAESEVSVVKDGEVEFEDGGEVAGRGERPYFATHDSSTRVNGARTPMATQARDSAIAGTDGRPRQEKGQAPPNAVREPAQETQREDRRFSLLEKAMREIREGLSALQREQKVSHERTVTAVVEAVTPAIQAAGNMAHLTSLADAQTPRFPDLFARLTSTGVAEGLAHELLDALPDFGAWSEEAQEPLAISALRDLIGRRVSSSGPISLTPGQLKAVALIGPTGVGKTTTIAKLAAHFALVQKRRVALLTMDTYRIAAVEQLKVYSQILDVPLGVAYSQAEALEVVEQYADYDLLLIDTAGRSQKNIMQVGELKTLLEAVGCETHLVLSAQTKEQDMVESAQRFSAARVDRLIFSKLDETDSFGTLLNVADRTGIPLSYLTTGQKVPEDLELADGGRLASLLLD